MATTLEIIRGISQVVSNTYDGALDADGEPVKIGLKREEGDPILDKRVMDGFKVRFSGPMLIISYHAEVDISQVHGHTFESDVAQMIQDIANFLKKEYKKITGNKLSLTMEGEPTAHLEYMSKIRCWVTANCSYKIGGLGDVAENGSSSEDQLKESIRTWISGKFSDE